MLILAVEDARPGMKLAAPVQNPEQPDQELLKAGYILEEPVLERVRALGIGHIYVAYPALDELDHHLNGFLCPARRRMYAQIKKTFMRCQTETQPDVAYQDYYMSVCQLIITLLSQGRQPIYLDHMARLSDDAISHAASVAHLSLLLGIRLESYLIDQRKRLPPYHAKEVVNLGVAGMLHDIGKTKLPEHLRDLNCLSKIGSEADRSEYQSHAQLGFELVRDSVESSAANAVLHHHQRYDGAGYPQMAGKDGKPRKLERNAIHVFARILHVADLYDRLATIPGGTRRRSNLEILWLMRTRYARQCDPVVLQTLHAITPPFPPGTKLELSDGTSAIVTEVNPADPFHPVVKRLNEDLWTLHERALNLQMPGTPTVSRVAGVDTIPFLPTDEAAAFMRA